MFNTIFCTHNENQFKGFDLFFLALLSASSFECFAFLLFVWFSIRCSFLLLIRFYPFGITIDWNCYLDERTEKMQFLVKTPFLTPYCIVLYCIVSYRIVSSSSLLLCISHTTSIRVHKYVYIWKHIHGFRYTESNYYTQIVLL